MPKNINTNEEIEFIEDEESPVGVDLAEKLKDVKNKLKDCQKEKQEYLDGWQRARADLLNFKSDEGKRTVDRIAYEKEDFITDLLPVLDSFDMAFQNKESWEKIDKNWRQGVEYIYSQLLSTLEKYNVSVIGETGVLFDPNLHQSIETITTDKEDQDHRVEKIIQKGYKMVDRIIRPARVAILEYKQA